MAYRTNCIQCGKSFEAKRVDTKYCSSTCRSRASREANSEPNGQEVSSSNQQENTNVLAILSLPAPADPDERIDIESERVASETRPRMFADIYERLERLEQQEVAIERLFAKVTSLEAGLTDITEVVSRMKRIENEQLKLDGKVSRLSPNDGMGSPLSRLSAKVDALETRFSPLAGLPERLRMLERRTHEPGDLAGRVEALEARSQAIQRVQKSVTELQAKVDMGLEEARTRRPLDNGGNHRLLEGRVTTLEQRIERVAVVGRSVTPPEDTRFSRFESRIDRFQPRVQTAPDEDVSGRLFRVERKVVALQQQLEDGSTSGLDRSPAVEALGNRIHAVEQDMSELHAGCLRMAYAVRALQGLDNEDENGGHGGGWGEDRA